MLLAALIAVYMGLAWFCAKRLGEPRLALAFSVAPLTPGINGLVLSRDPLSLLVVPFSYLFALAGVPVYFLFRYIRWLRIWQVVTASGIVGAAVGWVAVSSLPRNALGSAAYGAATGLMFWFIALSGSRSNNLYGVPRQGRSEDN